MRGRIERGREIAAADYIDMVQGRARLAAAMDARFAGIDALVMPTVPILAPRIDALAGTTHSCARTC